VSLGGHLPPLSPARAEVGRCRSCRSRSIAILTIAATLTILAATVTPDGDIHGAQIRDGIRRDQISDGDTHAAQTRGGTHRDQTLDGTRHDRLAPLRMVFFAIKNNLLCAPDETVVSTAGFARRDARLALVAASR
jgi:hypothetical protein